MRFGSNNRTILKCIITGCVYNINVSNIYICRFISYRHINISLLHYLVAHVEFQASKACEIVRWSVKGDMMNWRYKLLSSITVYISRLIYRQGSNVHADFILQEKLFHIINLCIYIEFSFFFLILFLANLTREEKREKQNLISKMKLLEIQVASLGSRLRSFDLSSNGGERLSATHARTVAMLSNSAYKRK